MRFVNTFSGGLDKDTTPTSYKPNNYYDARNFSIVVAEDLSSATLTNTKGVTTTITYDAGTTRKIVGLVETPTTLVIFIKCSHICQPHVIMNETCVSLRTFVPTVRRRAAVLPRRNN